MNQPELAKKIWLARRWQTITGSEIPAEIAVMSSADIQRKLILIQQSNTVCGIPRKAAAVEATSDSIDDWDNQDAKPGNYGGER